MKTKTMNLFSVKEEVDFQAHAFSTDKRAEHYPGWEPWDLDMDAYLTTFKGRQCAIKAGRRVERLDGVSPPSPHWFAGDIPSDALREMEGAWQGTPSRSEGSGEQQATMRVVCAQSDLFSSAA